MTRPRVVTHVQVSVDGRYSGMELDPGLYYKLAAEIGADGMMAGSETMLAAVSEVPEELPSDLQRPDPAEKGGAPYWFIVDSRGRVRCLHAFRRFGFCRDPVPILSRSTPEEHLEYLRWRDYEFIIAGEERVDLRLALEEISDRFGVQLLRVDSGGVLNSLLMQQGLVDELSLLVSPMLAGNETPDLFSRLGLEDDPIELELVHCQALDGGNVHLRYGVR